MTIQQCRYVIEIARAGSFNEAAKKLYIAQASLSASVKELEGELGIQIFSRSNRGIALTKDGAEFLKYARQITAQVDVVKERYSGGSVRTKSFSVSTQHYDFAAEAFAAFMRSCKDENYSFIMRETKTIDVITDVRYLFSDIGILALKQYDDSKFMEKLLMQNNVVFNKLFETKPYVFVGKRHPLSGKDQIEQSDLHAYPYISYEQGEKDSVQFSEEFAEIINIPRSIKINDRASLVNLLIATDGYTTGTGIMTSEINNGNIVSIPLKSDDIYAIGWIKHEDTELSAEGKMFVSILTEKIQSAENNYRKGGSEKEDKTQV